MLVFMDIGINWDNFVTIQESEEQPTFPDFSRQIQEVIDDFGAVFIKSNWSTPSVIDI